MSKELIARLRDINHREELADEAADRIEALEQATDLAIQINNGHVAEIERLEAERDTLADHFKTLEAEVAELVSLLARYRNETPLGHQPHMIAHLVDEALAKVRKP